MNISDQNNTLYFKKPPQINIDGSIRFMGYNILTSFLTDSDQNFPIYHSTHRSKLVVDLFKEIAPQISALVEFSPFQAEFLKKELPSYIKMVGYFSETKDTIDETLEKIAANSDHLNVGEAIAVLYDSRKIELISFDCLTLPRGERHERIATMASMKITATNTQIYVITTHLDHFSRPSRQESLVKIADKINKFAKDEQVIFYGDLNLFPDVGGDEDYRNFFENLKGVVADPFKDENILHFGPHGTYPAHLSVPERFRPTLGETETGCTYIPQSNRLDIMALSQGLSIDYTFTANVLMDLSVTTNPKLMWPNETDQTLISEGIRGRLFPSDHLPLICSFKMV